jgi:hypothetical protein
VFAGAAARPRRWVFLNKHFLTRAFGVGLKYGWVALSSYLRSRDTRLPFLKGRLKGIFLGLRTQTALRRNLLGFAERFQGPPVDPSAASHAASANGARKRCAIPHR